MNHVHPQLADRYVNDRLDDVRGQPTNTSTSPCVAQLTTETTTSVAPHLGANPTTQKELIMHPTLACELAFLHVHLEGLRRAAGETRLRHAQVQQDHLAGVGEPARRSR